MKAISEPKQVTRTNANGRDQTFTEQYFRVEESDVGKFKHHYLGYNHRSHRFLEEEVGCSVVVQSDGKGWTCWYFGLNWESEECRKLH
ncbi:hypothetical protein CH29_gp29 [Achromobacter phage JWAlpha]|uniref:Uncharacterized protein n=1 Tax=Achromobacter phage JWAlpha TaxID=1416009 RepID=V9VCU8_9CAUD|nr:hypothetical protein CH29_gp29 [Achromobacter phage JWAlpha]AHC93982.1 hypothetical protein JJJB_0029 [Achromobacter phage JWAlpha]